MINKQARAITGAFSTTPISPLVQEAALEPAKNLLEARQLGYTARILELPRDHPVKQILPATFREGNLHAQPGEQSEGDRAWAEETSRGPWSLGQHLARQLGRCLGVDLLEGFEETARVAQEAFPGRIRILSREEVLREASE